MSLLLTSPASLQPQECKHASNPQEATVSRQKVRRAFPKVGFTRMNQIRHFIQGVNDGIFVFLSLQKGFHVANDAINHLCYFSVVESQYQLSQERYVLTVSGSFGTNCTTLIMRWARTW